MSSAFINFQRGNYVVDKWFRNPKFKFLLSFSTADTFSAGLLLSEAQFRSNEIEEVRGIVTNTWQGTITEAGTNATQWTLTGTSGIPLALVDTANTAGLYIFTSYEEPSQSWADEHSVTVLSPNLSFVIQNTNETNFDFTLFPNRMQVGSNLCSGESYSYAVDTPMVGETTVTVNNVTNLPSDGVYTMRAVGFELMMMDEFTEDIPPDESGSGYTSAPTVTITGGGGMDAAADAVVLDGRVVDVIITDPGTGYTSAPTIGFTGGGGSGAIGTATITGDEVTDITVLQGGKQVTFQVDILKYEESLY